MVAEAKKPDKDNNHICKEQDIDKKNRLLLDLMIRRYDGEMARASDLDSKAGNLIGYVTIATGLLVGVGTFSISEKLTVLQYVIPFFFGLVFLMISIIMSLFSIRIKTYYFSPSINKLEDFLIDKKMDSISVIIQTFRILAEAVDYNFNNNEEKAELISISWIFLILGIGAFIVYVGIYTISFTTVPSTIKITIEGNITTFEELMRNTFERGFTNSSL